MARNPGAQEQASDRQLQISAREPESMLQGNDERAKAVEHRCSDTGRYAEPCKKQDMPAASELSEVNAGSGFADGGMRGSSCIQTHRKHNAQNWQKCHGVLAHDITPIRN
jgi:hypothetical protein